MSTKAKTQTWQHFDDTVDDTEGSCLNSSRYKHSEGGCAYFDEENHSPCQIRMICGAHDAHECKKNIEEMNYYYLLLILFSRHKDMSSEMRKLCSEPLHNSKVVLCGFPSSAGLGRVASYLWHLDPFIIIYPFGSFVATIISETLRMGFWTLSCGRDLRISRVFSLCLAS